LLVGDLSLIGLLSVKVGLPLTRTVVGVCAITDAVGL
jgi:hypothetical protein